MNQISFSRAVFISSANWISACIRKIDDKDENSWQGTIGTLFYGQSDDWHFDSEAPILILLRFALWFRPPSGGLGQLRSLFLSRIISSIDQDYHNSVMQKSLMQFRCSSKISPTYNYLTQIVLLEFQSWFVIAKYFYIEHDGFGLGTYIIKWMVVFRVVHGSDRIGFGGKPVLNLYELVYQIPYLISIKIGGRIGLGTKSDLSKPSSSSSLLTCD